MAIALPKTSRPRRLPSSSRFSRRFSSSSPGRGLLPGKASWPWAVFLKGCKGAKAGHLYGLPALALGQSGRQDPVGQMNYISCPVLKLPHACTR